MDCGKSAETQPQTPRPADTHLYNAALPPPQQPLQPPQLQAYLPSSSYSHGYYSHHPNPNPNSIARSIQTYDLGVQRHDASQYPAHQPHHYAPNAGLGHRYPAGASPYYHGGGTQGVLVKHEVWHYEVEPFPSGRAVARPPNAVNHVTSDQSNPIYPHNLVSRSSCSAAKKKRAKKLGKVKVVEATYCNVCKVDCTSMDVLDNHRKGKKHKKNLDKLRASLAAKPSASLTAAGNTNGAAENANKSMTTNKKTKKKLHPATEEELETKKRRVVEGGTTEDAVKVCTLCNVICNSQTVYDNHIAGKKHASMVQKEAVATVS